MKILNWEANIRKNSSIMLSQTYIYNLSNSDINFFLSFFFGAHVAGVLSNGVGCPLSGYSSIYWCHSFLSWARALRVRTAAGEKGLACHLYRSHPPAIHIALSGPWGNREHFDLMLYDSGSPGGGSRSSVCLGLESAKLERQSIGSKQSDAYGRY